MILYDIIRRLQSLWSTGTSTRSRIHTRIRARYEYTIPIYFMGTRSCVPIPKILYLTVFCPRTRIRLCAT